MRKDHPIITKNQMTVLGFPSSFVFRYCRAPLWHFVRAYRSFPQGAPQSVWHSQFEIGGDVSPYFVDVAFRGFAVISNAIFCGHRS